MKFYYFFYSFFYFLKQAFTTKHYRVIFYAPQHFNRGERNENVFFTNLLNTCNKNGIDFLYLEEPDSSCIQSRSEIAIPFDFMYYLILLLRKLSVKNILFTKIDKQIGSFLKKVFFRNITFDNYITISQSMLSVFNGISPTAKRFDLQHGTIHAHKKSYLYEGVVSNNLKENDVTLLLTGNGYKDILLMNDQTGYFENHIKVIGSYISSCNPSSSKPNKNVLVSLQFTDDHSYNENKKIADILKKMINQSPTFHFYLRNHPRFNNSIDISQLLCLPNVSLFSESLLSSFIICSFHLTVYSTLAFELGMQGIPTCFLHLESSKMDIFKSQYNYPFYDFSLTDLYNNYQSCSLESLNWAKRFYHGFCEDSFLKVLK